MPTPLSEAEGNMTQDANRKPCVDPARSETLCMSGSFLHRSWEVSSVPASQGADGTGKATSRNPVVYAGEKSDTPIRAEKPPNKGMLLAEAAEQRGVAKGNTNESPASRTQSRNHGASMGLEGVRAAARRDKRLRFTTLLHHITPELLTTSFYALKRQASAGVDGVTWKEYESLLPARIPRLHREIHTGAYRAQPSRRVFIPKADGSQRPLGIASIEDKIVQQAVSTVLSAIYEEDFLGFSYGFRQGRGQHDALDAIAEAIRWHKVNWILDADIQSFFDEVDHDWMLRFLEHRVADRRILQLIRRWLKAGVIEHGKRKPSVKGTPQGAVISPLLANIYLHYALDQWIQAWRRQPDCGEVIAVRYADDSVLGFQKKEVAERFLHEMRERLGKFGLSVHPEKTRLIEFGRYAEENRRARGQGRPETFDFLGFTHCCGKDRQGKFQVIRLTVKKRMRVTLAAIRETLLRRRSEPIPVIGTWINRVVEGYFRYFAVPTNLQRLSGFRAEVCRTWLFALRRRSQRSRTNWERFKPIIDQYVPRVRVLHPYPDGRFKASHPTFGKSRMR